MAVGAAGAVINGIGDGTFPHKFWRRVKGQAGMTYLIDISSGNGLRGGTEEDPGFSKWTVWSSRSSRRRESLGWVKYQQSLKVASKIKARETERDMAGGG